MKRSSLFAFVLLFGLVAHASSPFVVCQSLFTKIIIEGNDQGRFLATAENSTGQKFGPVEVNSRSEDSQVFWMDEQKTFELNTSDGILCSDVPGAHLSSYSILFEGVRLQGAACCTLSSGSLSR